MNGFEKQGILNWLEDCKTNKISIDKMIVEFLDYSRK